MTGKGIAKAFALVANTYGARFDIPTDPVKARFKVDVWADLLSEIPDDRGLAAFRTYCTTHSDWPPTPAHIREIAGANQSLPGAGVAWAEALEMAKTQGYCEGIVPAMSTPEAQAAARAVGWHAICFAGSERELSFTRSAFFRVYDDMVTRYEHEQDRVQIEGHFPAQLLPRLKQVSDE